MFGEEQKRLLDSLSAVGDLEGHMRSLLDKTDINVGEMRAIQYAINILVHEKTKGFPWLADAIAQYHEMRDLKIAEFLEQKLRPAVRSAERVREIAKEKRILQRQFRITRNLIRYYESLFPWLPEFVGEDVDELVQQVAEEEVKQEPKADPVKFYLTQAEYSKFSATERNQLALDRYWKKKKRRWELGRDYERYIGYLYERDGYSVHYQGIVAGLEDLGRDLIAKRRSDVQVIQCKYWAHYKTIHEKHICQLLGTTLEFWIQQKHALDGQGLQFLPSLMTRDKIRGVFVTSTSLSDVAREFAKELEIEVRENFPFERYPCVKCNVSRRTGEKIYHLPIDQQYDRTIIEEERNECYVETVAEAEELGFRRAWRWKGSKEQSQESGGGE